MAHRTNVNQVPAGFFNEDEPRETLPERVNDPVCGMELERKTARHMLFRGETTYYFCSKDCQSRFGSNKIAKAA